MKRILIASMLSMAGGACSGEIGSAAEGAASGGPAPPAPRKSSGSPGQESQPTPGAAANPAAASAPASCKEITPGPSPLRRLTPTEYDNTVRDLFNGATVLPAGLLAADAAGAGFDNDVADQTASPLLVDRYDEIAETVAAAAMKNLPALMGCPAPTDACVKQFVAGFGKRAFRRPLEAQEIERVLAFFGAERTKSGVTGAIEMVLRGLLQSPHFLYRLELGGTPVAGARVVKLDAHQTATRLSYFLWNTMPDATLTAAADAGLLATREQVGAQARRLLDDERSRRAVGNFHQQWLNLAEIDQMDKDTKANPGYLPDLRPLLRRQIDLFLEDLVYENGGKLETLLLADYQFANQRLATFYKLGDVKSADLKRVSVDGSKRLGILGHPGILAATAKADQSSPIHRGLFVRQRLLCHEPPPPPDNMEIVAPVVKPGASTKERFAQHAQSPACAGCHTLIDPLGFAFESFDAVGRWRDQDQGRAIDATGTVTATEDADGPYNGPVELIRKLARSEQVARCVATQWFRFSSGRVETPQDACTLTAIGDGFKRSGHELKDLILTLVQTDSFLYREAGGSS